MKVFFRVAVVFLLFLSASAVLTAEEAVVAVYSDASSSRYGRALNRSRVITVPLDRFSESESVETGVNGIATAVMIDASVKKALDELLSEREYVIIENSVFSRLQGYETDVYGFSWDKYGFDIAFSFDENSKGLTDEIEKVYGRDAYLFGELLRSYDDNYALRIFKAEDLYKNDGPVISFREVMISATVIGSTFQPLLGIHDGIGVLNELGIAAAGAEIREGGQFVEYRQFQSAGDRIYSFLHSVEEMEGDFVDNLYNSIGAITHKHSEDNRIMLPEEFFDERSGDNTDYALFYYDMLKRKDYQVRFIVIDSGSGELYSTVFFREKGADLWGVIDGNGLEREKASKWQRLPALVFTASVNYFEPDIESMMSSGNIELPPPSRWTNSPY
ncbi:MAG: hypothetical protein PQJ61_11200 [Spirochaetales bacterium]|uniref:Uncharacterized protein n=1 Tax=Candidatus Thalassospirochaeta sargassi TaxID=3119039 RepID=A0AAJ1IDH7_9SPIO|nr:hypothetical protein [Spirochaetales bacterium]